MKVNFYHEIKNNPEPENVGKISITATINEDDNLRYTTSTLLREFLMNDEDCESKEALNNFLEEAGINDDVISDTLLKLVCYVGDVTVPGNEYSPNTPCLLEVKMDLEPDPRDYIDYDYDDDDDDDDDDDVEAVQQISFDEVNDNIESRPASQFTVNGLPRNIYQKNEFNAEECSVCQEEFYNGQIVLSLPCGHDFHEQCILRWLETSHACPLCRFQLPFDD